MFYITFICILCDIAKFLILNVIVVFLFGPVFFVHFITGTIILELSVKLSEFNGNFNWSATSNGLLNITLHQLSSLLVNETLKLVKL